MGRSIESSRGATGAPAGRPAARRPSTARDVELRFGKPLAFLLLLAPGLWLAWRAAAGELGAEPIETLSQETGRWTLRVLLVTLAITPARRWLGWSRAIRYRRMAGLFAFAYGSAHLLCFVALDQFFDVEAIAGEVAERRWITIGMASWLLLVPLALTSTDAAVRRLGGRRWRQLHRLVYASAVGGVLHSFWAVKADTRGPLVHGAILAALLGVRLARRRTARKAASPGVESAGVI